MNVIEEKKLMLHRLTAEAVARLYSLECDFEIIRPRDTRHGQFSATAALELGRRLRRPPVEIAREISAEIALPEGERAEAMGKGFVNFFLGHGFLLSALKPAPTAVRPLLPELSSPDFESVYEVCRLYDVLGLQGTEPDGREDFSLLVQDGEIRLLWALFGENEAELRQAALDFYDRIGLRSGYAPLDMARYILLSNAVGILIGGIS